VSPEQRTREDTLVREHLPLVGYLVAEALGRLPAHVRREDLTAAGMVALALAARAYDPERGVPFGRFASVRIRGAILDELRSQDWASRSVRSKARAREHALEMLTAGLGRPPTPEELAESMGITVDSLRSDEDDVHRAVVLSLSATPTSDDDTGLVDLLPPDRATPESLLLERERRAFLLDAVACLPDRLRTVVVGYFLNDRPMAEIAAELGVTESRISQMRAEAVTLLRSGMDAQFEPDRLERPERPDSVVWRRREAYHAAVASHRDFRSRLSGIPAQRRPAEQRELA
jgi:RNA polymerase sigma factor for flagellar operon FliA